MSLRDLRKALGKTQVTMADRLGIKQENVSRIEQRSDMLLSTLNSYLRSMGGRLRLVAEFEGRPPVGANRSGGRGEDDRTRRTGVYGIACAETEELGASLSNTAPLLVGSLLFLLEPSVFMEPEAWSKKSGRSSVPTPSGRHDAQGRSRMPKAPRSGGSQRRPSLTVPSTVALMLDRPVYPQGDAIKNSSYEVED